MRDLFSSARRTLGRAKHHISELSVAIDAFVAGKPWSYIVEPTPDGRKRLHKIRFDRELSPDVPCLLFDAANNLRAVLDQAGYASAVASGRTEPKHTKFPFGDNIQGLTNAIARGGSKDLPREILDLFVGFKPYFGGNNNLWALNKLCNTKKHCSLVPVQVNRERIAWAMYGNLRDIDDLRQPSWDENKRERTFLEGWPDTVVNFQGWFKFTLAIESVELLKELPANDALRDMTTIVENVVHATEAECKRIGLVP